MEKVMLSFDKVSAHYGKIQALHEVSLHINQGEIVTLIGANGAGKTTLLGTLCGDPRATSGRIVFDDKDITDWQTAKIMREAVAIVPEGRRVFSRMTVEENLAMGGFFAERDQFQERIKWVYELFPRLHERRVQRAGTMSGGEQQMLAIGRALMSNPRLLLLDEPSLGLAPIIIQQIFDTIEQLREQGKITAPNSPRLRVNDSATPATSAGESSGSTTLQKLCQRVAPSVSAASSYSGPNSSSTGCTVRTTNGMLVKAIATAIPSQV